MDEKASAPCSFEAEEIMSFISCWSKAAGVAYTEDNIVFTVCSFLSKAKYREPNSKTLRGAGNVPFQSVNGK